MKVIDAIDLIVNIFPYPMFETTEKEKRILRKLEIHLIYNPRTNPFAYLERQSFKVSSYDLYFKDDYLDYYNLTEKFSVALSGTGNSTLYNVFRKGNVVARIYITKLLNYTNE